MEKSMNRETRRQTEFFMSQVFAGLEGLAKLHGDSLHIGAGMRREGRERTLIVYNTNPRSSMEIPKEIWLPQRVPCRVAILTHRIPMHATATDEEEPLRYSRKNPVPLVEQADKAVRLLVAVGE